MEELVNQFMMGDVLSPRTLVVYFCLLAAIQLCHIVLVSARSLYK